MSDRSTVPTNLPPRLARLAALARARLTWERYAPALAIPALVLSLFLIVSWLGVWDVAGDPLRLLAILALLAVMARGAWACRKFSIPSRSDALRRLERTAGLSHRPLDTLQDRAVLSDDLWPAHAAQAERQSEFIRRVGRTPALSPIDRFGLRGIIPLLIGLSLFFAWGFSAERTRRALSPQWHAPTNPYAVRFEAWVDPPEYTGRPPIYAERGQPISAPQGSTLVVRATGARTLPRPRLKEDGRRARFLDVRALGSQSLDVRAEINASATLDWRIGPRLERFKITTLPDAPPLITVPDTPEADKRDRLVVTFDAEDDYGIDRVLLEMIELTDDLDPLNYFASGSVDVETGSAAFKSAEGRTLKLDLTRHPLAGRKVAARLVAVDGAGQRGVSEPLFFTVPDRIFVEPLAKAIVEQRGLVMAGIEAGEYAPAPLAKADNDASDGTFDTYQTAWRLGRAPAPVQRAVQLIDAVTDYPTPSLFNDPAIYMSLRHTAKSLRYARSADALGGLPDHLWTLAMRAEFGVLGSALEEMQEAEEALREGIARRVAPREIDTLFDRYNQAVDNFMEELRNNAEMAEGGGEGGGANGMGSVDEIQELLDAIEEANARGDTQGARRALAQLAELLENMKIQLTQGGGGSGEGQSGEGEMSDEMRQSLEDLADLLGEQRELQDETQRSERDQAMGREGEDSLSPEALAQRQAELADLLRQLQEQGAQGGEGGELERESQGGGIDSIDELLNGLGGDGDNEAGNDVREGLAGAGDAMRQSDDALRQGDLSGSRQAQSEAIAALRRAAEGLANAANQEGAEGQDGEGTDPLGRSVDGGQSDNSQADIDDKDNAARSREILEELRRRAAEAEREKQEREYLDRLLRRF